MSNQHSAEKTGRKAYHKPVLGTYGNVTQITQGGNGAPADDNVKGNSQNKTGMGNPQNNK